jgi:hypothetical protein
MLSIGFLVKRHCAGGHSPRRIRLEIEALEDRVVPTYYGNQLFPLDNPWNQQVANAPVAANSAAIIQHIIDRASVGNNPHLHPDFGNPITDGALYGIPVNVVSAGQPTINVVIDPANGYPSESDIVPVPIPAGAVIEGDLPTGPASPTNRGDSHLIVYDKSANIVYELYLAARPTEMTFPSYDNNPGPPHTTGQWGAFAEAVWNLNTDSFRTVGWTSADAAGLSILAGLARPDEALPTSAGGQGAIDHALRLTVHDTLDQYVYPASHFASNKTASNLPRMGERFRLKASVVIPANWPPEDQAITQAMKTYGLIVADNGSDMFFSGVPSTQWNDNNLNLLKTLRASDFEVVNLTPAVTGLSSSSGAAGSSVTLTGYNFSGAAGNLHVLFGTTPATNFTINSDTQITATVPPGSGTVDVTVQSGSNTVNSDGQTVFFGYGTSATSAADRFTITSNPAPPAPTGLMATGGNGQVMLTWTAATGATSYKVYRGTAAGGESATALAAGVTTPAFTDNGVTNGTTYFYEVTAVNAAGESGKSKEVSATPQSVVPTGELFAIGLDNQVYSSKLDASGNLSGGYFLTRPGQVKAIESARDAAGDPLLFVLGLDNQVYEQKFDGNGNSVSSYVLTQGGQVRSLIVGHDGSNHPEVFVLGLDNQVYASKFDAGGNSAGAYFLTAPGTVQSLAVGSDPSGDPVLFAVGNDAQVYEVKFNAAGSPTTGFVLTSPGRVLSIRVGQASNHPELFAIGLDNQVYAQTFDVTGSSSGYFLAASGVVQSMAVGNDTTGNPLLFAVQQDGQVYEAKVSTAGGPTATYVLTRPGRVAALAVRHDERGNTEVLVLGLDGQVYGQHFDGSGNSLGGYFLTAPGRVKAFSVTR